MATFLVFIAILVPAVLIIEKLAHETTDLYAWLNEQKAIEGGWREYVGSLVDPPLNWVAARTGMGKEQLRETAMGGLQNVSTSLLNWAKSFAMNLARNSGGHRHHAPDVVFSPARR